MVGRRVAKYFKSKVYYGVVEAYEKPYWLIKYDDNDEEHFDEDELKENMRLNEEIAALSEDETVTEDEEEEVKRVFPCEESEAEDDEELVEESEAEDGEELVEESEAEDGEDLVEESEAEDDEELVEESEAEDDEELFEESEAEDDEDFEESEAEDDKELERVSSIYVDSDKKVLSSHQCLLRKQIEIFETGPDDVGDVQGRINPICLGQVGIRCRHCASATKKSRASGGVYYSKNIRGLYQVAQNMAIDHLEKKCKLVDARIRAKLIKLRQVRKRSSEGTKEYWAKRLRVMGIYENKGCLRWRKT
jgi:hypothetical protein